MFINVRNMAFRGKLLIICRVNLEYDYLDLQQCLLNPSSVTKDSNVDSMGTAGCGTYKEIQSQQENPQNNKNGNIPTRSEHFVEHVKDINNKYTFNIRIFFAATIF